ncbi:MAG TPA: malto-oligosyltrehalose trehalohydrolase [Acidimicrobiales bacterium]
MTTFRVWAPAAGRSVEVVVGGDRYPMTAEERGWWGTEVAGAGPGTDYAYSVDGGEPRPDPRSPWQPEGVHGPSRVVDHSAFAWTDATWSAPPLASAVVEEVHVGTFTPEGTFDGVIGRLDHLVDLGVTHVELLPVAEFPGSRGWGYDGVDLYAPHSAYGGPDGLKRLVDACHARGLAVLLDVVYNHLGPAGNYLSTYGPYFTDRYRTPWGDALNFDGPGSDGVREHFVANAIMWLRDYHVDGLRLDAVHAIVDTSATHLLEEIAERVEALSAEVGRSLVVVAESDLNDPRVVRRREVGGYGMDAQWSDDFHHALHVTLTGETSGYYEDFGEDPVGCLATALRQAFVAAGGHSAHRDRRHGRLPAGVPGWRFLGYAQNHDQVGNRATGERLSQLVDEGRLRVAAALVLTAPFVPMLFQGEEWGASTPFQYFTAHDDPDLGRAVSEGRRREFASFGWAPEDVPDPQDPATFERSRLRWDEVGEEPHAGLLDWHRRLIALRRSTPDLLDGRLDRVEVRVGPAEGLLTVRRGSVLVAVNVGKEPAHVDLGPFLSTPVALAWPGEVERTSEGLRLPPAGVAVLSDPASR